MTAPQSYPAYITPAGRKPALTVPPVPGRADCPHCKERIEVLVSGRLAWHYGHGPGMGIPCPTARRCTCGRPVPVSSLDGINCAEHDDEVAS